MNCLLQKSKSMNLIILLTIVMFSTGGCVFLVAGGVGALGGYIVSPDTIEGTTERTYDEAWDSAVEIVSIMGRIEDKQESAGTIQALVNNGRVWVSIIQFTQNKVLVRVKARKAFFPKINLAQDVYVKIVNYLNE